MGSQPSTATPMRHVGSWSSWSHGRRRLVIAAVTNWLVAGVIAATAILVGDARILLLGIPILAFDWWASSKLLEAQYAEGALADIERVPPTPEEQELLDELDTTEGDRAANLVLVRRWLAGDTALRRYEYPTRELLQVRSISEAIEVLGLALVLLTAPEVVPVAIGGLLWLLGGRWGVSVARATLAERLYRTPVDDATRERWLDRERKVVVSVAVIVLALAAIRFIA